MVRVCNVVDVVRAELKTSWINLQSWLYSMFSKYIQQCWHGFHPLTGPVSVGTGISLLRYQEPSSSTLRFAICRMSSTLSSLGLVFSSRLPHVPGQSSRIIRKEGILFISNCFQFPLEVDSKMIASQSTSNPAVGPVLTGVFHFHLPLSSFQLVRSSNQSPSTPQIGAKLN